MKKNEHFITTIEDMSEDGAGVGKTDGFIWFIKDTVIGDVVEASAMKMKKSYGYARLVKVLTPSPYRVEPKCPVARQCGGCQLQMMDYQEQLRFKERKVYNHLRRIGGLENLVLPETEMCGGAWDAGTPEADGSGDSGKNTSGFSGPVVRMEPIMGMENPWRYRNKAQFPFGRSKDGRIITGFYAGRTHDIVECEDCLLGVEENRPILEIVKGFMERRNIAPYDEKAGMGLVRHCLIRKGFATGELMVCLVVNGSGLPHSGELVGIANQHKPGARGDNLQKIIKQRDGQHGCLVHHNQAGRQVGVLPVKTL